jgi:hypothetical protein
MRSAVKVLSIAVGLTAVLATTGTALAHDHDGWKHWRHHHHHGPRFVPPGHVYYVERPVIHAPPPPVYYPEPMYYGPPPQPSLNINIPLR